MPPRTYHSDVIVHFRKEAKKGCVPYSLLLTLQAEDKPAFVQAEVLDSCGVK
jgi:hypothetical protein